MQASRRFFLITGSLCALLSIALGAFAAHGLRQVLDERMLTVFRTGVDYQQYHALGLLVVGLLYRKNAAIKWLNLSGYLMLCGILLFSGSLYCLSLLGVTWFGIITPFGGLCFMLAWACLAMAAVREVG